MGPHRADAPTPRWIRRVGCVTTSRADAGIYRPLLRALASETDWQTVCFAGGTHHAARFGRTIGELADLPDVDLIAVDHLVAGDGPNDVAETAGRATGRFSRAFSAKEVDLVFVLGDRTEMLAATLAAVIHRLPIAHLHGGDMTEGAYDDACRHAITKLSHLHFPALPQHAERIRSMGEEAWRVHTVGALALDALSDFTPEPLDKLNALIGLDLSRPTVVVAFHPETLSALTPRQQVEELLAALAPLDVNLLLIGPNADVGHGIINEGLSGFAASRPGAVLVASLGQRQFWTCLSCARLLIGNSSAGILEAATFRLPVVNVGDRQTGRMRPANVIDAPWNRAEITAAIETAMEPGFKARLVDLVNPYGDGRAAGRILAALRSLPDRQTLLQKRWTGPSRP
ncbi:MAG: UDP-N-acetylglucosamine 2-epimerase (hydrolyzing) [Phycisphaerae bacterium]|nr:UDP-N-acetylglucosamine 2-epimerase (hydrolyzing) [Phycisphaerae bacterium]